MKRVCLLTGASGALGSAFIASCAEQYQIAAVHHRNAISFPTQDQEYVDPLWPSREVEVNSIKVYSIRADLRRTVDIDRTIHETIDRFGRIDLLINAAAVRHWSGVLETDAIDCAENVFQTNVLAPLRLSVELARAFLNLNDNLRDNRNIINISSTAGLFVYQDLGQALYGSSKAALNHLTYHLASELWDIGIRVNAIAPDTFPGRIPTEDVIRSLLELDDSKETGRVIQLLSNGNSASEPISISQREAGDR